MNPKYQKNHSKIISQAVLKTFTNNLTDIFEISSFEFFPGVPNFVPVETPCHTHTNSTHFTFLQFTLETFSVSNFYFQNFAE
jgi:hypothetical protein